jgi:hypothetical protein
METADLLQDTVVRGLEPEFDPDRYVPSKIPEDRERIVWEGIGPGRQADGDDGATARGDVGFDDRENLAQALVRHVGFRVRLEVRDGAWHRLPGLTACDAREARAQLQGERLARAHGTRAGTLHIAVDATAEALGAVPIRARRTRVEGDAVDGSAEGREEPRSQSLKGEIRFHPCRVRAAFHSIRSPQGPGKLGARNLIMLW